MLNWLFELIEILLMYVEYIILAKILELIIITQYL